MKNVTFVIATAAFVIPGGIARAGNLVGLSPFDARDLITRGRAREATDAEIAKGNAIGVTEADAPIGDAAAEADAAPADDAPAADTTTPAPDASGRSRRRRG